MNNVSNVTESEDDFKHINDLIVERNALTFAFLAIVIVSGIVGNGFSFAFYGFVEKKTVTSFLITVLAVNDLFSSVVYIEQFSSLNFMLDFQTILTCSLSRFFRTICIGNSLIFLGPVGLDRCLKICVRDPRYHMTWRKAAILSMSLTLFSVLRSVRQFFTTEIIEVDILIGNDKTVVGRICAKTEDSALTPIIKAFGAIDSVCFAVINIVIIVVYLLIIRKVTIVKRRVNAFQSRAGLSVNTASSVPKPTGTNVNTFKEEGGHEKDSKGLSAIGPKIKEDETDTETLAQSNNAQQDPTEKDIDARNNSGVRDTVKDSDRPQREKVELKLNIMLTSIAFSSILSYMPYVVILLIAGPVELYTKYSLNALFQIAWRSPLLNSSINPYVIGLFNTKFRQFVKRVLRISRD